MNKRAELLKLAKLRQSTRWEGYGCIGDYHGGRYECDYVSPYTKSACNVDAHTMIILQDWRSEDFMLQPFNEESARLGYTPSLDTNINLIRHLQATFGLRLQDTYATNLFPLIKPGKMKRKIPQRDLIRAAEEFALPQVRIVNPRHVICAGGKDTFNALRQAHGLRRCANVDDGLDSPFQIGPTWVWCQAHTGYFGQLSRGGPDGAAVDWQKMRVAMQSKVKAELPS